jgi:hypothetical protein
MAGDRIGTVVTAVPHTERAGPRVLVVHSGRAGCGLAAVPVDQIESVDHEGRRLVLHDQSVNLQQAAPRGARHRTLTHA